jgi:hypothetical protein
MCVYSFFKSARGSYSLGACQLEDLQYQLSYQQAIMEGAEKILVQSLNDIDVRGAPSGTTTESHLVPRRTCLTRSKKSLISRRRKWRP